MKALKAATNETATEKRNRNIYAIDYDENKSIKQPLIRNLIPSLDDFIRKTDCVVTVAALLMATAMAKKKTNIENCII